MARSSGTFKKGHPFYGNKSKLPFKKGMIPWNKGKKGLFSKEARKKMSEAAKGRVPSQETRRKISEAGKGRVHSLETRKKMGLKGKKHPFFGKHPSLETRRKISEAGKGRIFSPEHRRKNSEAQKGEKNHMFGKQHSLETRRKMAKAHKGMHIGEKNSNFGKRPSQKTRELMSNAHVGEKNAMWLGGKSFEPYGIEFNNTLKEQIRKRDNYRCQECFRHQSELRTKTNKPYNLLVHHIDYNKENNCPNNLISLCCVCHGKTGFNRGDWTKYFSKEAYLDRLSVEG